MVDIQKLKNNAETAQKDAAQKLQLYKEALDKEAAPELEKIRSTLSDMIANDIAIKDIKEIIVSLGARLGVVGSVGKVSSKKTGKKSTKKNIVSVNENTEMIEKYIKSTNDTGASPSEILKHLGKDPGKDMLSGPEWKAFRVKKKLKPVGPALGPNVKYKL